MINDCGIIDCGREPGRISKSGGFVWARLDRVLTNPAWADVFLLYYGERLSTLNIESFSYAYPD